MADCMSIFVTLWLTGLSIFTPLAFLP
jgi:hypothetical protein